MRPSFGTCRNGAGAVNYCAVGQKCGLIDRSVFAACAAGKRGGNNEYASFVKVPAAFNRKINRVIVRRCSGRKFDFPPKDSASFRFCCCTFRFRCRTFKFRCFPCVFVCNAIILRLTAFRLGFCAIGLSRGSVVFGGNAQGFILLTRGFVRFAGRFCPRPSGFGGFRLFSAFALEVSDSIRPFSEAALLFPLPRVRLRRNFARFRS